MIKFFIFLSMLASAHAKVVQNPLILQAEFSKIIQSDSPIEISGFVEFQEKLFIVSDNKWDTWLYQVSFPNANQAEITKGVDLKKLKGYWPYYFSTLLTARGGHFVKSPWDIEGAASCENDVYIVNEQARDIIKLTKNTLERIEIDFAKTFKEMGFPLGEISPNAGFEGIAIDCENQTIYIAQERSPRRILVVNLESSKVTADYETATEGLKHPDYADLLFKDKHLYILERNNYRILKVSPQTNKVVGILSYSQISQTLKTSELYDTGEPFGLAEALHMDQEFIYIGLDNNINPFSKKAEKSLGLKGNHSSILVYKRPKNF